ncbi:helix-turn-helix domain-containing protein [Pseudomonas lactis]|nr:helix-turn-helix domain-containing protein [Pseudomonas lactis]PRW75453.1 Crp/Fnr family transcriptional regulator [Pseudomonas fluorescens]PRW77048.1 Crp/Fnr family transcriptional regulator [Pseudomonas fluorescens]
MRPFRHLPRPLSSISDEKWLIATLIHNSPRRTSLCLLCSCGFNPLPRRNSSGERMHSKGTVMLDLPLRQTLLARSDLFRGMPEHLLRYVATHMVERTLDDRELLYFKDDTLEFIALVVEGRIYSVVHGPDGREQIIGSTGAGQVVGETALIKDHGRESSTFASGPTRLLQLGSRHFGVLFEEPAFLRRLLMLMMLRLLHAIELLELVCLHRLESRLARFLLANLGEIDLALALPSVSLPASQGVLASMLNTSRPKLNVQLQVWRRSGVISGDLERMVINDVEHLRRKAFALN